MACAKAIRTARERVLAKLDNGGVCRHRLEDQRVGKNAWRAVDGHTRAECRVEHLLRANGVDGGQALHQDAHAPVSTTASLANTRRGDLACKEAERRCDTGVQLNMLRLSGQNASAQSYQQSRFTNQGDFVLRLTNTVVLQRHPYINLKRARTLSAPARR